MGELFIGILDNWLNSMDEIKKEVENDIDREVYEC